CSKCHEQAHPGFTSYLPHATAHDPQRYPWLFWTFWAMTTLLVGTLVVALAHSAAWLVRLLLTRGEWQPRKAALRSTREGWFFRRFTREQRIQHMVMLLAFFDLAITGMALKFSSARWATTVARLLGGPDAMRVLHRVGAIALVVIFICHVVSVLGRRRREKRTWKQLLTGPDTLMFCRRDWNDLRAAVRWFLGRGPRPRFERYTYWEKFDYSAVFWGVAVIGVTGLMLWFPEAATHLVPGWFLNVATIIHSDEALLAVVFIFTIHFFNSHLRPDKWPMDMVMFTGRMPLEELRHEKALEYERLEASGELQKHLTGPFPAELERVFRIFGFLALGLGIVVVVCIVWALLGGAG
ncbi:MAG TPA: cytochrome C, partial [Planctomycetota bacterium]|nr:cytochrome C [Planctomycetota bacterium]